VRVAAGAERAFVRESLPRATLRALDCMPHPLGSRHANPPGHRSRDPVRLRLDEREQPSRRVDESREVEPRQFGRDDPPVKRKVAALGRKQ